RPAPAGPHRRGCPLPSIPLRRPAPARAAHALTTALLLALTALLPLGRPAAAGPAPGSGDAGPPPVAGRPGPDFLAVAFADAAVGGAVGAGGAVLKTTDGGATWTPQPSGTAAPLFGVAAASADAAWAVGAGGTVLHTVDGGATWRAQRSGTGWD